MKILIAQCNFTIGDLAGNFARMSSIITKEGDKSDVIVFSELSLTGYPPNDLLQRTGFVDEQLRYVDEIQALSARYNAAIIIGAATKNPGVGKPLFNSAIVFRRGEKVLEYHKQLLPTYNIYDENRYFEAGISIQNNVFEHNGESFAVLICEDCWNDEAFNKIPLYPTNPIHKTLGISKHGDKSGLSALITVNASPSDVDKYKYRYEMYSGLAKKYRTPIVYVNQFGGNDSLIFDGNSFVVGENGDVSPVLGWVEGNAMVNLKNGSFDTVHTSPLSCTPQEIINHLVVGVRDYIKKNGFKTVVIGESGGIDSAVVTMIACMAIGPENVYGVTMPSKVSSEGSVTDSELLCKNFGVRLFNYPIKDEVHAAIAAYEKVFGIPPSRLAIENMQARIRGRILMEFSNTNGALVLSTGNKSEMSVGYCTIYGDMCGGLSVIGDVYKMEVYGIAKYANESIYSDKHIPAAIIDKAPSAELWDNQKDTDSLPAYPILDAFLRLYLERDMLSSAEIREAKDAIKKLSIEEIERLAKMVDRAEFKRRQAAPVIRVHKRAFGFGRHMPIAQRHNPSIENVL